MASRKKTPTRSRTTAGESLAGSGTEALLLAALAQGGDSFETGRYLITYRDQGADEGAKSLKAQGFRIADARDFKDQAVSTDDVGDADALLFAEIGVAVVSGDAARAHGVSTLGTLDDDSAIAAIEPEYFVFANNAEYLRGFSAATHAIARDLGASEAPIDDRDEPEAEVLGATWGLRACRVPPSARSGAGIKVAVLDTGFDLGHPDFAGRPIVSRSFVGQPVQDLNGHGTHCIGTASGPRAPAGTTPRYGIGWATRIFAGKVLSNSGSGTTSSVLAGINWAIANRCEVISLSLGAPTPVQAAYTAAGQAALNNGLLIVAAAGNDAAGTGSPANSPTILSVASLDSNLQPSSYSNFGRIEIAAPGRDVFSAWPRPTRYRTISGTSMAAPHVAGCAALWAQTSPALRGLNLWRRLQATARRLPFPASKVGAGLVQAPL
jgi:subtilisin